MGHAVCEMELDAKEILEILPHRYPFLLVDRVLEIDIEGNFIVGLKNVTMNEAFFQGHFPGAPIMPGVLILEALAQTGGILLHKKGFEDKIAVFLSVNNVKFRQPIRPGDTLILRISGGFFSSKGGRVKGEAFVGSVEGPLAAQAEIGFALVDRKQI